MHTPVDATMMRRALAQAAVAAAENEVPVGAVVYRGDDVLAEGRNRRESAADPTAHAEILALREAAAKLGSWHLDGCSIAVTLEPCPMCAGALINARIERLVYGAPDPKMGCIRTFYELVSDPRFNHRVEVANPLLADECGRILSDFFAKLRAPD